MISRPLRLMLGSAVAIIIGLTAGVAPLSLKWINDARSFQLKVEDRLVSLRRVQQLLVDAETGQRGYIITGKELFLQPYQAALETLPSELQRLENEYGKGTLQEQKLIQELVNNARLKLSLLSDTVQLRQREGFSAVEPIISSAQGKHYMDEVRRIVAGMGEADTVKLARTDEDLRSKIHQAIGFSLASALATLGLLGYLAQTMIKTLRHREHAAAQAHRASEELEAGMVALQHRNDEVLLLGEMSRVLQTEMTLVEGLKVTSKFCSRLMPSTSGSIYLFRNSANLLELAANWGAGPQPPEAMEPDACWGLRLGHLHRYSSAAKDLQCRHYDLGEDAAGEYHMCLPLMAYGEVLGLMHLRGTTGNTLAVKEVDTIEAMAHAVSEQVALSLSNAKLRQVLRDQSIKDSLTGLYNRRYMEETLLREMVRSKRAGTPVSVIMVDLDHFKQINDTHGHLAGDGVLRAAAQHIASVMRACDVSSRYGGEEFVLVLVNCSKAAAMLKAQQMCDTLRGLTIKEDGRAIAVTASFGVATAPDDAQEPETLIAAADHALYQAKRAGRNQVWAAGGAALSPADVIAKAEGPALLVP